MVNSNIERMFFQRFFTFFANLCIWKLYGHIHFVILLDSNPDPDNKKVFLIPETKKCKSFIITYCVHLPYVKISLSFFSSQKVGLNPSIVFELRTFNIILIVKFSLVSP